MSKELVIGSNRHETKVAILEDDQLVEVYFQRENEYSLAGSIHKGRVTRVLPGMQSAFVDLGLERDTFLYVSDFFEEHEDIDTVAEEQPRRGDRAERGERGERGERPERGDRGDRTERGGDRRDRGHRGPVQQPIVAGGAPEATVVPPAEAVAGTEGELSAPARSENGEPGNERGFRGDRQDRGDRGGRGRRSRRRRHRGGFPETKYATAGAAAPSSGEPSEEPEAAEEPADVIVLPGESLAKYRRASAGAAESEAHLEPEHAYEEEHASEEDLAQEAAEIALTDLVFSHREEPQVEALEERVAGVEEQPEAQVEELETVSAPEPASPIADPVPLPDIETRAEEPAAELKPPVVTAEPEPSDSGLPSSEPIALDDYEVLTIQEGLTGVDEPLLDDLASAETTEEEAESSQPETAESSENPVQSASVREPGNRSMHRVSRRMRRRRGGNRFSSQAEGESSNGGAAAGAAIAPDVRTEMHREGIEDKAVERPERTYPSISDLLKPGQEIIVQIAKEPLGQKGARITSHIALPGRYVVFMPSVAHLGVSRKIASDEERQRLKRILQAHRPGTTGGFIVRTAGEGVPEDEIASDMSSLYNLWLDIRAKAEKKPAPALLHHDLDIVQRILRDQVTSEYKAIWVDNEDLYENVVTFMQRFQPALVNRVKMYTRSAPIFDAFNITQELEKALRPKVWLKSGGYIVINQTEALVAIDINTGKYVGKSNRLEDTIVKTNTEAVKEIVRQIRLRDLGGIIVVDFIDMDERKNRQKVMQALEEAMRADKAPYKILQFNDFGLVAITRKRVKQSLERTLCSPCPYCEGAGYVKSVQTVISEILVEAQKLAKAIEGNDVMLRVHPDVAKVLKASDNRYLEEIEEILGRPVLVKGDPTLHHQKFDLG